MRGVSVVLHERIQTGVDAFNVPVYSTVPVTVANVLVGQPTTEELTGGIDLYGKRAEYVLGLPKGDTHAWEDCTVEIFGQIYQVFGYVIQGIEANVPTPWHRKVMVARYG